MQTHRVRLMLASALCLAFKTSAISITDFSVGYAQDFNSLASSGTSATTMPAGWSFQESGTSANGTYRAGTGSSATGDTYGFGSSAADRALGSLNSGSVTPILYGAFFRNDSAATINSFLISYTGEQWRMGEAGVVDRLNFQYSTDASSLTTGNWIDFDSLDFVAPVSTGSGRPLDGNDSANRQALSATLSGFSWTVGSSLWIRFSDVNATGSDHGMGVDDFRISAAPQTTSVPEGMPLAYQWFALALPFALRRFVRGK